MDATLSRGGTTVNVPLVQGSQSPLLSRTTGKPHLTIRTTGAADPYFNDNYSGIQSFNLVGRFAGSAAFDDAITLADMLKNHGQGNPITFNVPLDEYDSDIKVVPAGEQQRAAAFNYLPGRKDYVTVDVNLTRVSEYRGADSVDADLLSNTPTAAGSGPIQLSDGTTTVDLVKGVEIERTVGRPNSTLNRTTAAQYPAYIDNIKTAYDYFDVRVTIKDDTTAQTVRDLNGLINQRLGRSPLSLDFNGLYGMGSFDVVPEGSDAQRDVRNAGSEGVSVVPSIGLRRVGTVG